MMAWSMLRHNPKGSIGFTLIEVLIALAIMSIALTALLLSNARAIQTTTHLREKMLSHLLNQQIFEVVSHHFAPTGKIRAINFFQEKWYWQAHAYPTSLPDIERIEISSSPNEKGPFSAPLVGFRIAARDK